MALVDLRMPPRRRLAVLLSLLALSLVALNYRDAIQSRLYGAPPGEAARTIGAVAPELPALATLDGGPTATLEALRGRVVLLHFWTFG